MFPPVVEGAEELAAGDQGGSSGCPRDDEIQLAPSTRLATARVLTTSISKADHPTLKGSEVPSGRPVISKRARGGHAVVTNPSPSSSHQASDDCGWNEIRTSGARVEHGGEASVTDHRHTYGAVGLGPLAGWSVLGGDEDLEVGANRAFTTGVQDQPAGGTPDPWHSPNRSSWTHPWCKHTPNAHPTP